MDLLVRVVHRKGIYFFLTECTAFIVDTNVSPLVPEYRLNSVNNVLIRQPANTLCNNG